MKIACCQTMVSAGFEDNLRRVKQAVHEAADRGAELVLLPEMCCCPYALSAFAENAEPDSGRFSLEMSALARECGLLLCAGTMPERENDRIYNSALVFDSDGKRIAKVRKLHLFDVDLPDATFHESDCLSAGERPGVFSSPWGNLALAVCFDLRFPELFVRLGLSGARLVLLPAAFHPNTGKRHWELLLRARALDAQAFVVGCSPSACSRPAAYGHSMVVSPQGEVLAGLRGEPGMLVCELDLAQADRARAELPTLRARRTDIYG